VSAKKFGDVRMWVGSHPKSYVIMVAIAVLILIEDFRCNPTHIPTSLSLFGTNFFVLTCTSRTSYLSMVNIG
jgi:hypothetical protein